MELRPLAQDGRVSGVWVSTGQGQRKTNAVAECSRLCSLYQLPGSGARGRIECQDEHLARSLPTRDCRGRCGCGELGSGMAGVEALVRLPCDVVAPSLGGHVGSSWLSLQLQWLSVTGDGPCFPGTSSNHLDYLILLPKDCSRL